MSDEYGHEPPGLPEHELSDEAVAYLRRKAAIEVFAYVSAHQGFRFTDLEERLDVSTSTLTRRLGEGRELGLLETQTKTADDGSVATLYFAAGAGKAIHSAAVELGIRELHRQLQRLKGDLEDRRATLLEHAEAGHDELRDVGMPDLDEDDVVSR